MTTCHQVVAPELLEKLRRGKNERRCALAHLPIEEKVRIVVELQQAHNEVLRSQGKPEIYVWEV